MKSDQSIFDKMSKVESGEINPDFENVTRPLINWGVGDQRILIYDGFEENVELTDQFGPTDLAVFTDSERVTHITPATVLVSMARDGNFEEGEVYQITAIEEKEGKRGVYMKFAVRKLNL